MTGRGRSDPNRVRVGASLEWGRGKYPSIDLDLKHTGREQLALLASEEARQGYVADVVSGVGELWKGIKEHRLLPTD